MIIQYFQLTWEEFVIQWSKKPEICAEAFEAVNGIWTS